MSSVKLPDWIDDDEVIRRFSPDGKVQKLPPWTGDDRAMLRWLSERLFAMADVEMGQEAKRENDDPLAHAIRFAKCGVIGPLRELYPDIAEFINLPRRGRGERFSNLFADNNPILYAALDTRRIRALWKRFYGRRRSGHHQGDKSAEWFAAQLWTGSEDQDGEPVEITEGMVVNRLKKLRGGRVISRRKKRRPSK
jgi:hypothetical protein